jgi:DNA polymerase alpha subunit A
MEVAVQHLDPVLNQNIVSILLESKFKFLELTKQLTKVTGCLWDNSLRNSKTARNEMLIMHHFAAENYILPDYYKYEPGVKKEKKLNSNSYQGGQVINPKKGLYKDYVLMLDFASLYPSIIREFEICFTSVQRAKVGIQFYTNREAYEEKSGYFYDDIDIAGERHYLKLKSKDKDFSSLSDKDMYIKHDGD